MANGLSLPKRQYNFGKGTVYKDLDMDAQEIVSGEEHLRQSATGALGVFTDVLKKQQEEVEKASNQSQFELAKAQAMDKFSEYQIKMKDPLQGVGPNEMIPGLMNMSDTLYKMTETGIENSITKSEYQSWFNQEVARQKLTVGTLAVGRRLEESQGRLELVLDNAVKGVNLEKIYELTTAAQAVWGKDLGIAKIQNYLNKAREQMVYLNVDNQGGYVAVSDALQGGDQSVFKDDQGNWLVDGETRQKMQASFYDMAVDNINNNNRLQTETDEEVGDRFINACAYDAGSKACNDILEQLQKGKTGASFTMTKRLLDWHKNPAVHDNPQAIGHYNELFFNVNEPISNDALERVLLKYVSEKLITSETYGNELEKLKTRDPNRVADASEQMVGQIYKALEEQTRTNLNYMISGNYNLDPNDTEYNEQYKAVNDNLLASVIAQGQDRDMILSRIRAKRDENPNITSEMLLGFALSEMGRTDSFKFLKADAAAVNKANETFTWRAFFGGVIKEYGIVNLQDMQDFRDAQMDALDGTVYNPEVYSIPLARFLELEREQLLDPDTIGFTPGVPLIEVSKTVDLATLGEGSSTSNLRVATHQGESFAYKTVYLTTPRMIRAGPPTASFSYYDRVAQETTLADENRIMLNKNAPLILTGARRVKIQGGGTEIWGRVHVSGNVRELVGFTGTRDQWRGMDAVGAPTDISLSGLMEDIPYYDVSDDEESQLEHVSSVYSRGDDNKFTESKGNALLGAFNKIKNESYWILLTKSKNGGQEWYVSDELSP